MVLYFTSFNKLYFYRLEHVSVFCGLLSVFNFNGWNSFESHNGLDGPIDLASQYFNITLYATLDRKQKTKRPTASIRG